MHESEDYRRAQRHAMATGILVALAVAVTALLIVTAVIGLRNTARIEQLNVRLTTTVSASAHARVTTVEQRCELTLHLVRLLAAGRMPETAWFQSSYAGCEKQLVQVRGIAAHAP
jgi:hypothetical protein